MTTALLILAAVVLALLLVGLVVGLIRGDLGCAVAWFFGGAEALGKLLAAVLFALLGRSD